jgi:transposase
MSRTFKTVDYDAALDLTVRLGDCLPPDHLARFVVDSVALLDLSALYARYGSRGGEPYAPEGLLALLLYGYATGVFSSRKIERATYESVPFRFIAGNRHPDHDTIAAFRRTFLPDLKALFVQVLLLAQEAGVLTLGTISLDGTKIHADASTSKAVSYKRLREIEAQLQAEVEELFALAEQMDERERPDGLVVQDEIARRADRLARLAEKAVREERARERATLEQAAYDEKMAQRAEQERATGRRPRGRVPTPPVPGPRAKDQDNFTDPDARIMKNPTDQGFDQDDNAQVAVDQQSLLIVGTSPPPTPTPRTKPRPRARPSPRRSARRTRRRWTMAMGARRRWRRAPTGTSSPPSPRGVSPIIKAGRSASRRSPPRRRRTPAPRSKWPTSSKPLWAKRSTVPARVRSSPSWASSPKCAASASSRCGVKRPSPANGSWSAWPSISSVPYLVPGLRRSGGLSVPHRRSCAAVSHP